AERCASDRDPVTPVPPRLESPPAQPEEPVRDPDDARAPNCADRRALEHADHRLAVSALELVDGVDGARARPRSPVAALDRADEAKCPPASDVARADRIEAVDRVREPAEREPLRAAGAARGQHEG